MSFRSDLIRRANLNPIMEMDAAGMGLHAISGVFRDYGIEISPNDVVITIKTYASLGVRPLPRAAVKAHINGARLAFNPT